MMKRVASSDPSGRPAILTVRRSPAGAGGSSAGTGSSTSFRSRSAVIAAISLGTSSGRPITIVRRPCPARSAGSEGSARSVGPADSAG